MINSQKNKVVLLTPPAAIVDNAPVVTAALDTKGFNAATIYVQLGATDVAVAALKLQQSDLAGSGFVDVDGGNYAVDGVLPGATDDNKVYAFHVNLLGKKRYLDVSLTGGDGTTGAYFAVLAVLSRGETAPNSASERGLAAELFV